MPVKRIETLDIAKGLLIILVVIGHSGSFLTKYIFWFHMPAFFFISGLLFKKISTYYECKQYIVRKFKSYGVLYLSYFVLLTIVSFLYIQAADFSVYKTILKLIIGGRFVGRELGVFWYISCLLFALIIFSVLQIVFKQRKYQYLTLILLYIFAHLEAYVQIHYKLTFFIPLNLDVSLLAVCYIAMGYYGKELLLKVLNERNYSFLTAITTIGFFLSLIILDVMKFINYQLDMKGVFYNSIIGDIMVPAICTLCILSLSKLLVQYSLFKFLSYFGRYSIAIMFLHFAILEIYKHYFHYNWVLFSIAGSIIPLIFALICDKYKQTRILFLTGIT
jgi:fucose 4-O-acetylase-like acetyltransferase